VGNLRPRVKEERAAVNRRVAENIRPGLFTAKNARRPLAATKGFARNSANAAQKPTVSDAKNAKKGNATNPSSESEMSE